MTPEAQTAMNACAAANPTVYLSMIGFARVWVDTRLTEFTSEDLKAAYYKLHQKPKEPRIWGRVMTSLKNYRLIFFHDYTTYKDPAGHGRPCTVWISRALSLKQQERRTAPYKGQFKLECQ